MSIKHTLQPRLARLSGNTVAFQRPDNSNGNGKPEPETTANAAEKQSESTRRDQFNRIVFGDIEKELPKRHLQPDWQRPREVQMPTANATSPVSAKAEAEAPVRTVPFEEVAADIVTAPPAESAPTEAAPTEAKPAEKAFAETVHPAEPEAPAEVTAPEPERAAHPVQKAVVLDASLTSAAPEADNTNIDSADSTDKSDSTDNADSADRAAADKEETVGEQTETTASEVAATSSAVETEDSASTGTTTVSESVPEAAAAEFDRTPDPQPTDWDEPEVERPAFTGAKEQPQLASVAQAEAQLSDAAAEMPPAIPPSIPPAQRRHKAEKPKVSAARLEAAQTAAAPTPPAPVSSTKPAAAASTKQENSAGAAAAPEKAVPQRTSPPPRPTADTGVNAVVRANKAARSKQTPNTTAAASGNLIDPTKISLRIGIFIMVVGLIIALILLRGSFSAVDRSLSQGIDDIVATSKQKQNQQTPAEKPQAPTPAPQIASVAIVQPGGDGQEQLRLLPKLTDGDPNTPWHSRWYARDDYAGLQPFGIVITLKEEATVKEIEVTSTAKGGQIDVYAGTEENPKDGKVLATGEFGGTPLKFSEPVKTKSLVLWITKLPTDVDGKFRATIQEITLK